MQNNTINFCFPLKHSSLQTKQTRGFTRTQKKREINIPRDQKENENGKEDNHSHNAFSQIYKIHNNELTNTTNQQFLPRRNRTNHG